MKTKEQIEAEIKRLKKVEKQNINFEPGTDGYFIYNNVVLQREALEWVLDK